VYRGRSLGRGNVFRFYIAKGVEKAPRSIGGLGRKGKSMSGRRDGEGGEVNSDEGGENLCFGNADVQERVWGGRP